VTEAPLAEVLLVSMTPPKEEGEGWAEPPPTGTGSRFHDPSPKEEGEGQHRCRDVRAVKVSMTLHPFRG